MSQHNQTNEAQRRSEEIGKPFRPTRKLVVDREWSERTSGDGYWILLKDGYHVDNVHAIHEATKRDAVARIRDVRICACIDCTARKSR